MGQIKGYIIIAVTLLAISGMWMGEMNYHHRKTVAAHADMFKLATAKGFVSVIDRLRFSSDRVRADIYRELKRLDAEKEKK